MGNRLYLTFLSVLAGVLIFAGIALPLTSYRSYTEASHADFRVKVEAQVKSLTVADADENNAIDPNLHTYYAPVVHFDYKVPGEETSRTGQEMIPYSKYWSKDAGKAKKLGESLHPVGSPLDLYLSEKDPGKWALQASETPAKTYLFLTPFGLIIFLGGCFLLLHRARVKKRWFQAKSTLESPSL